MSPRVRSGKSKRRAATRFMAAGIAKLREYRALRGGRGRDGRVTTAAGFWTGLDKRQPLGRPMTSFLAPLLRSGATDHVLVNARTRRVIADRLLTAFDSASRRRGLLGRDALPPGTALIIAPSNAVHTFFMRFAIDVVFVGRDGRVIKVRPSVPPWRMTASLRGFTVIEFAAGTLAQSDTTPGDLLICQPA